MNGQGSLMLKLLFESIVWVKTNRPITVRLIYHQLGWGIYTGTSRLLQALARDSPVNETCVLSDTQVDIPLANCEHNGICCFERGFWQPPYR